MQDKLKYDNLHFDIGGSIDIVDIKRSPYEQLRDAILGQGDIAKKQNYIAKFITSFTSKPNLLEIIESSLAKAIFKSL